MQSNNVLHDWLNRRKITNSVIESFNIDWGYSDLMREECVIIPVLDPEGKHLFNKYRRNPLAGDIKPKYWYDKGSKVSLFGANKIKNEKTVLITEGEIDCLVAWSFNIPAVSSTGGAMSFQKEWASLFTNKEVILCFDNDSAGAEGMVKALSILPSAKVLFLPDRPGIKDISDYTTNGGDLQELIRTAVKLDSLDKVIEDRAERQSLWKSTYFHDKYIEEHSKPSVDKDRPFKSTQTDEILRAKEYPIDKILSFTRNKAKCIWHNERSASMHYFKNTNSVYCFGCGKGGDSIAVYRQIHKCSFGEAIKKLK